MRIDRTDPKQVYAYATNVTVSQTIEEIRKLLLKYNAKGFAHVVSPNPAEGVFVAFALVTKQGEFTVRVNVPSIFIKGRYLERESYRAALLIIKSKFIEIDMGEPAELVFLGNMPGSQREKLLPHVDELPMLEGKRQ
jgi:hypothetical protein